MDEDDDDGLPNDEADGENADGDDEEVGPPPILHSTKNETFIFDVGVTARLPCKIENDGKNFIFRNKIQHLNNLQLHLFLINIIFL